MPCILPPRWQLAVCEMSWLTGAWPFGHASPVQYSYKNSQPVHLSVSVAICVRPCAMLRAFF